MQEPSAYLQLVKAAAVGSHYGSAEKRIMESKCFIYCTQ